ncbi:MAG TPA: 50S ribosomal protein L10 [Gemmatimonadales bacterium]|jgi:large subunit ribosomal protein L10|nr:50S ribosomal protein L10 [Gemmatimonadales bacterium]
MSSKAERQDQVAVLTDRFKGSPDIYVTDFSGLSVGKITELRRRLRAAGARYVVVKNTLAQRALAANQITVLDEHLAGPTGLVVAGKDPLAAAKVISDFAREHQKPQVRIGLVDGKAVNPAYVKRLGELPSRDALLGQFAGALNGVLYQMVGALEALREKRQAEAS